MPHREKSDHAQIVQVYMETQSGRETARRLGLHENTVYQILKMYRGTCRRCSASVQPGQANCDTCKKYLRGQMAEKNKQRRRDGLCQRCDSVVEPPSQQHCAVHRIQHQKNSYAHHQKLKGGSPRKFGAPRQADRERHLRYKYGDAGVRVWRQLGGQCILCDVPHSEKPVHIHHIDGNDTNHADENLTCLCLRCHHMVHYLIDHPHLARVLSWLRETYPLLPWPQVLA